MAAIFAWWAGSAVVLIGLGLALGLIVTKRLLGLLIDSRGRYSLTHLQLSLWTIVILSLLAGVFFGRWQHNVDPLGFTIPSGTLGLIGISAGSAVAVTAAKVAKNTTRPANVAASAPGPWRPSLTQIFLQEEGSYADQVVDITKFQNFVITVVLVLAYIGLAVHTVTAAGDASKVTALPTFGGTFLVLLGISHAGYLAGKLPAPSGQPAGLTVASQDAVASAVTWAAQSTASPERQPARPRRGQLWRSGANVWSDQKPVAEVPASEPLVVTDTHPFVLHWTADNSQQAAHDDTASAIGGGQYAVMLTPAQLKGATTVEFTRRYPDPPAGVAGDGGGESTPPAGHLVRLNPSGP